MACTPQGALNGITYDCANIIGGIKKLYVGYRVGDGSTIFGYEDITGVSIDKLYTSGTFGQITLTTPKSAADITLDWLRRALPWPRPGCEPVSIKVEPNFGGPSLLGRLARVKLNYAMPECGPSSIIVKFQARGFDREARIYQLLSEASLANSGEYPE